jgi:predicted double-glycine peptidase
MSDTIDILIDDDGTVLIDDEKINQIKSKLANDMPLWEWAVFGVGGPVMVTQKKPNWLRRFVAWLIFGSKFTKVNL